MKRSAGVTVVAILSLIGSLLTFAMGILIVVIAFFVPFPQSPASPMAMEGVLLAGSLVYFLPGVWGILTSVGLWRLKNWARISIIVFSVLLVLMGGFSGLISLLVPFPIGPNNAVNPSLMFGVRIAMGAFWLTLLGIGVWWLVFFNRAKVKEQFGQIPPALAGGSTMPAYSAQSTPISAEGSSAAKRPLSITILAWLLLVVCLFAPLALVLRTPVILLTKLLTGWPAALLCLTFAALQLWIGVGLLRLKPAARIAAIAYFAFGALNSAAFYLAPGSHARMLALMESERAMFPWMRLVPNQPEFPFDSAPFLVVAAVAGLIGITIPLYFLITRKAAFEAAADVDSGRAG